MTTVTDTSYLHNSRQHVMTPVSRAMGDLTTSTAANMTAAIKNPHFNSLVTFGQDMSHSLPNAEDNFQKFSTTLLKNKALLVPRRLALKRQRASLRPSLKQFEPISTDTLQLELGNPDDSPLHSERDYDERMTLTSHNMRYSREMNRMHSTSNHTTPLREDTPHTLPADISLMYRYVEKIIMSKIICICYFSLLASSY